MNRTTIFGLLLALCLTASLAKQKLTRQQKIAGDSCGKCMDDNNIFCIKGGLYQQFELEADLQNKTYCCDSLRTCPYKNSNQWTCTSSYSNYYDKVKVCPFVSDVCGPYQLFNNSQLSLPLQVPITTGTQKDNICLYKVIDSDWTENFTVSNKQLFKLNYLHFVKWNSCPYDHPTLSTCTCAQPAK